MEFPLTRLRHPPPLPIPRIRIPSLGPPTRLSKIPTLARPRLTLPSRFPVLKCTPLPSKTLIRSYRFRLTTCARLLPLPNAVSRRSSIDSAIPKLRSLPYRSARATSRLSTTAVSSTRLESRAPRQMPVRTCVIFTCCCCRCRVKYVVEFATKYRPQ